MKVSVAGLNNEHLSNAKTVKHRNSGLKTVSMKNTPFPSPKAKIDQPFRINESYDQKLYNHAYRNQQGLLRKSQQQNEIVLALFEKCLRPQVPNITHNSYETDELDSRVIVTINRAQSLNSVDHPRQKSNSIKIGSKAQKYRQNNKSEPKKVYDQFNLSSNAGKSLFCQTLNRKKTQRKINTKILMTKKNSPQITEFCSRLRKFSEDLIKTKKPKILTLDLNSTKNNIKLSQNQDKNYLSLKNHQSFPKSQPILPQNVYTSPQLEPKRNTLEMDDIQTVNKEYFPKDKFTNKDNFQSLEKTKKIISNVNFVSNQILSQDLLNKQKSDFTQQIKDEVLNIESLLPKEEIQFVLNRFKKDEHKKLVTISQIRLKPIQQLLHSSIIQAPCQKSPDKNFPTTNAQVDFSSLKQMQSISFNCKQVESLRVTDYGKKAQPLHKIDSPVTQRRKSVCNLKQRQSQQNKLRCLNEGAKTIVTKYDSSDKRSIVEESVILFQCSKDLKPSFNRELLNLNDYAARYRGSLGVETLINQNQQQQILGNSRIQGNFLNESGNSTFENILMTPLTNNSKLRKSYSIKEIENNNF